MIDLFLFKLDSNILIVWFFRVLFLAIGLIYIIYVLLQIRQIGIMNSTLKTRVGASIAFIGILHLILVISCVVLLEILLFSQN
jgi:hypothetical protein